MFCQSCPSSDCNGNSSGVPGLPKIVFMCPKSFYYPLGRSGSFVFSLDGFEHQYVGTICLSLSGHLIFLSFDLFANGFYKCSTCHTSVRTRTHIKLGVVVRHLYTSLAHSEKGTGGRRVPRRSHVSPAHAAVTNSGLQALLQTR